MTNPMNTDAVRAIVSDQQELAKELGNLAIENQKLAQKQLNVALDSTRASMEMARDFTAKSTEMWAKAVMPKSAEA